MAMNVLDIEVFDVTKPRKHLDAISIEALKNTYKPARDPEYKYGSAVSTYMARGIIQLQEFEPYEQDVYVPETDDDFAQRLSIESVKVYGTLALACHRMFGAGWPKEGYRPEVYNDATQTLIENGLIPKVKNG